MGDICASWAIYRNKGLGGHSYALLIPTLWQVGQGSAWRVGL